MTSCRAAGQPGAPDVDRHDSVPPLRGEIPNGPVAPDAGVVDQDVEAAPFPDGSFDQRSGVTLISHVAIVRNGFAPARRNQFDCEVCVLAGTFTGDRTPQIIDHDACTATRQFQSVAATDAMAGPRHHGDLSFEQFAHAYEASLRLGLGPERAAGDLA